MTTPERTEVREMIHGILSGWQAATIARDDLMNNHLGIISERLDKINGSVAKHEKLITENLPHTILHCTQADSIETIKKVLLKEDIIVDEKQKEKDELRKTKEEKRHKIIQVLNFIGVIIAVFSFITLAVFQVLNYDLNSRTKNDTEIIKKDMEDTSVNSRGLPYSPYLQIIRAKAVIDSLKNDSINVWEAQKLMDKAMKK
jgi:uncharacterized DUF497 family protein